MKRGYYILLVGTILYAACRLLINQQELLFAAQDMLVWRDDQVFLSNMLSRPYAIVDMLARFLTTKFYHPWIGILYLLVCWITASLLCFKALRPGRFLSILCILPIFCLLSSITQMGYWIYFLIFSGYWFFFSLFWLWWSLLLFIWLRLHNRVLQISLTSVLVVVLTPWNGWQIQLFSSTDNQFVLRPLWVLSIILLLQLLIHFLPLKTLVKVWEKRLAQILVIFAFGAGIIWSTMLDFASERFSADLKSLRMAEAGDWKGILELSDRMKQEPSRQFILLRDAALLHTGHLLSDSLSSDNADLQQKIALSNPCVGKIPMMREAPQIFMAFSGGPMVYLCFGFINDAYRWAFEYGIENGLTTQRIRLLLLCALLNEEWDLCNRYIRLLRHIPHQADFVTEAETLVGHPEMYTNNPLFDSVNKIRQKNNKLRFGDSHVETILLTDPESPILKHSKWHTLGQQKVSTY